MGNRKPPYLVLLGNPLPNPSMESVHKINADLQLG